ncbi:hypothetical protein [Mangrovibacterium marinum]|uniref:Uncharacterized protein n=1 Tax=Mangrovibacterium marinum TaxID=1639118 RepID=A0A2T5C122_9BACT|nr:hypothetical protein [Mangrovibacterium marinum]PTN08323.1 hypothetical protein C8N47_10957 [Mangrovibacterium marinum]
MRTEKQKLFEPVSHHKIQLQQYTRTIGDCYHPSKMKQGIHCTGNRFEYVVPWEVRKKTEQVSASQHAYS